jgi:hypothetical protein
MANSWLWLGILLPVYFILIIFDRAGQIKKGKLPLQPDIKTSERTKKVYKIACIFLGIVIAILIFQMFFTAHLCLQHRPSSPNVIASLLLIYIFYAHMIGFQLTLFPFFQENLRSYKRGLLVFLGILPWLLFGVATCLSKDETGKEVLWKYLSPSIAFWVLNFPPIFLSKPWMKYYMDFFNAGIDHCARAVLKLGNRKIRK